jgi:hypothetical protein
MKKQVSRNETTPVQEKDLVWFKGASGYAGEEAPVDQPPTGSGG